MKGGFIMKQISRKGKPRQMVRGTVLFTVVTVMMVMVVFLMSTLILVTSSKKRAHYSYYENQAQYAAQAALDAITSSAYSDEDFFNWVDQNAVFDINGNPIQCPISVDFSQSSIPLNGDSGAVVDCTIEAVPDNYIWSEDNKLIYQQRAWKITSTATVGTGKNAAEYTICNYIYEKVREAGAGVVSQNTADNTWVSGFELKGGTAGEIDTDNIGSIANSVYTLGGLASGNNMSCLGPQTAGVNTIPGMSTTVNSFKNNSVTIGNGLFVGNVTSSVEVQFVFQNLGEGAVFYGDYAASNNNGLIAQAVLPEALATSAYKYKDVPYVYVSGTLDITAGAKPVIGSVTAGRTDPVNMYLGSIKGDSDNCSLNLYGDMFLYDASAESTMPQGSSQLYQFVTNQIQKANYEGGYIGGDLICNNQQLSFTGTNNTRTIGGDLIMTNPNGVLYLENGAKLDVQGSLVVAGKIVTNGEVNIMVDNGVYVDVDKLEGTVRFNGQSDIATAFALMGSAEGGGNTQYSAKIESLGLSVNGTSYADTVAKILNADTAGYPADYHTKVKAENKMNLMPFCSRLDEIHEVYYRWDLAQETEAAAITLLTTDPWILESVAAGHTWQVKKVTGDNAAGGTITRYVPYTTPKDAENHAFIKELQIVSGNSGLASTTYYEDLATLKSKYFATAGSDTPVNIGSMTPQTVQLGNHDADGNVVNSTINDAYVITDSCVIDMTSIPMNNTRTIFIDPVANGYGENMAKGPLVVVLSGKRDNTKVDIVINNTVNYNAKTGADQTDYSFVDKNEGGVYSNPSYGTIEENTPGEKGRFAGRRDVIIFLEACEGDKANNLFSVICSGAYAQYKAKTFDVVSNPLYPDGTEKNIWNNLSKKDKYKFELVPNVVVFGQKDTTYSFQNGVFMNAEVLMPTSTFHSASGDALTQLSKVTYRELTESVPYTHTKSTYTNCVGTMYVKDYVASNVPLSVYIGDAGRTSVPEVPPTWEEITKDEDAYGKEQSYHDGDYFDNNYQGAS